MTRTSSSLRSPRRTASEPKPAGEKRTHTKVSLDHEPTPERILQLAWGFAPPLIVETALNYGVFDSLDRSPKSVEELATQLGASTRGLRAILNALVGLGFLTRAERRYRLTPESATFLVSSKPSYYGTYFTHMTRQLLPRWMRLSEAVKTGRPVFNVSQENTGQKFFSEFVESLFPLSYQAEAAGFSNLGWTGDFEPDWQFTAINANSAVGKAAMGVISRAEQMIGMLRLK